nr:hypothetical protein [Halarchaeum acidiphilum]
MSEETPPELNLTGEWETRLEGRTVPERVFEVAMALTARRRSWRLRSGRTARRRRYGHISSGSSNAVSIRPTELTDNTLREFEDDARTPDCASKPLILWI